MENWCNSRMTSPARTQILWQWMLESPYQVNIHQELELSCQHRLRRTWNWCHRKKSENAFSLWYSWLLKKYWWSFKVIIWVTDEIIDWFDITPWWYVDWWAFVSSLCCEECFFIWVNGNSRWVLAIYNRDEVCWLFLSCPPRYIL